MSETVADLANSKTKRSSRAAEPHRLELNAAIADNILSEYQPEPRGIEDKEASLALSALYPVDDSPQDVLDEEAERAPRSNKPFSRPVGTTDVFMDDFIQAGQGKTSKLRALRRHPLHSVDKVLSWPATDEKCNEAICRHSHLGLLPIIPTAFQPFLFFFPMPTSKSGNLGSGPFTYVFKSLSTLLCTLLQQECVDLSPVCRLTLYLLLGRSDSALALAH
jgi:hypothetical protein